MEQYKRVSGHAQFEREERIVTILTEIGFDRIVYEGVDNQNPTHRIQLTDTGILLLVSNEERPVMITAYLVTVPKLVAIYKGGENIPKDLKKRVIYNQKKFKYLFGKD